jgi:SulP family sulfate permease
MLAGMIAATTLSTLLHLDIETIGSRFGDLPRTLPSPGLPPIEFSKIQELISPALTIGLLAAIESLLSATVADGMVGGRHRPNTELIGQGIANIASVCFGGIPATGAIARTATNVKSGGKTPVAGIIHAITLALVLLCMAPLAKLIPLSVLAGILVVISYNMSEIHHFVGMFKAPRSDVMVLLTTFTLTVLVDLTVAVQVGIVLASLLFIRRMAEITSIGVITKELSQDQDEVDDPNSIALRQVPVGVEVFEVHGPFFFGAADKFQETLRLFTTPLTAVILRLRNVTAIDATGIHVLREFHKRCIKENSLLVLSGVHAQPLKALQKCGLWDEIGEDNMHTDIDGALTRVKEYMDLPPSNQ